MFDYSSKTEEDICGGSNISNMGDMFRVTYVLSLRKRISFKDYAKDLDAENANDFNILFFQFM